MMKVEVKSANQITQNDTRLQPHLDKYWDNIYV